jgi:hypothetical protein
MRISTEILCTFPDIRLTITSSITFLMQRLVGSMLDLMVPVVIYFSGQDLEAIRFDDHKQNATDNISILDRRFSTFRIHCVMLRILFNISFI